jgi:hypothetical protein
MAKVTPIQTNFTGGEISPRLLGRVDLTKYTSSMQRCENFICFPHGGVTKRSGTRYVAEVKDSSKRTRLVPFVYSTVQAYILEFGDGYIRFYRNNGQLQNAAGTAPYEIISPYAEADLDNISFTQSADVLYLVHPDYAPRTLSRTGPTNWTLTSYSYIDGPFDSTNSTSTTMAPSAVSGTVTITASGTNGINDNQGFLSTDVGRHIRIKYGGKWGSAKIITVTSDRTVTATTFNDFDFGGTATSTLWRLGSWSDTTGWPTTTTFYQERLFFANTVSKPNTVWGSVSGDFVVFSPTNREAEVLDDSGLTFTLATDQVNAIRWMYGAKQLQLGTSDGPFIMSSGSDNLALTPTNVTVARETTDGTAATKPVGAAKATLFIDRNKVKLRELAYTIDSDGYTTPDLTLIAEHITTGNLKEMTYTKAPDSLVWCLLETGEIRCLTYEREQDVVAWHRHIIGGTDTHVKAVASIPSQDETVEELWMIVQRTIDGVSKQYVEYLEKAFDQAKGDTPSDAFFVDSGLTYSGAAVTTIAGLDHLEGQTVKVLVNGATHPDRVVSSGEISLDRPGTTVHIGLGYKARIVTLDPEVQTDTGPSQGKTRRVERVTFRVVDTYNLSVGTDANNINPIYFRTPSIPMGTIELYTGDKRVLLPHTPNRQFELYVDHDQPQPCTILAIMYALIVSER